MDRPQPGTPEWEIYWNHQIRQAQSIRYYFLNNLMFKRIPYGHEHVTGPIGLPCHDCGVAMQQFHVPGCDVEECPKCHGQAITCECND